MLCPRCKRDIPNDALYCCYCSRVVVRKGYRHRDLKRANGSGTAQRRGETWTAIVTLRSYVDETGKYHQVRKSKGGFKTRTEALDYCSVLKKQQEEEATKVPCLNDYWKIYKNGELKKLSDSKQTAYTIAWNKCKKISFKPINELRVADLRKVVSENAKTYYPARDMKVLLGHLFNLASVENFAQRDLPDYIILPELHEKERRTFSKEEQNALWKIYEKGDRNAALPLIMIYTGMMPGEMQELKVDMVNFDRQVILGAGLKTKVRKASPIYIPDVIVPMLQDEISQSTSNLGYVWTHNEDIFYKNYYSALEAAGTRRLEPYCCRHTTATALAINENIAPQTVRKVMRWSTAKMLDKYAHPDDNDAKNAVNELKK